MKDSREARAFKLGIARAFYKNGKHRLTTKLPLWFTLTADGT